MSMIEDLDGVTLEAEPKCQPLDIWVMVRKEAQRIASGLVMVEVTAQARATWHVMKVGGGVTRCEGRRGDSTDPRHVGMSRNP